MGSAAGKIKAVASFKVNSLKDAGSAQVDSMKATGNDQFNSMKAMGTDQFNSMKATGSAQANAMKAMGNDQFNSMKAMGNNQFNSMKATGNDQFNSMKATGNDQFNSMKAMGTDQMNSYTAMGSAQVNSMTTKVNTYIEMAEDFADVDDFSEDEGKKTKVKSLAPEQMVNLQDEQLAKLQELIKSAQRNGKYLDADGEYTSEVKEVVMTFYKLYHQMSKAKQFPPAVVTKWRNRIATIAKTTKTLEMMCDIVETMYPKRWFRADGKQNELVKFTMQVLQSYSAASPEFSMAVASNPDFCETIKEMLEDELENNLNKSQTVSQENLTASCMLLVRTLSVQDSNIGRLREIAFIPILVSYLATPKDRLRLGVLSTLAALVNEKECESIKTNVQVVKFLLKVTAKDSSARTTKGWSNKDSLQTIHMLARNDANKKLLVELGALEILVKMAKTDNADNQYAAVSALWQLSFDVEVREKIATDTKIGVVDLFTELQDSRDERVSKVCTGALWTLRDIFKSSSYMRNAIPASLEQTSPIGDGYVMISYEGTDQKTLKQIADHLGKAGIKVWIDIDQVGGSTLEAKAKAVDEASVVIMGISQKYKNGPFCRAVAEHASQRQKTIIPLKMEKGYMPDGWLGLIGGATKHSKQLNFCGKYKFEERVGNLLKELAVVFMKSGKQGSMRTPGQAAPPPSIPQSAPVAMQPQAAPVPMTPATDVKFTKTLKTVRGWQPDEVTKWVEKHDLKSCGVDNITGNEVAFLMRMNKEAPESYFDCLQDPKKMKQMLSMSKMTWALDDLNNQGNTEAGRGGSRG